MSVPRSLRFENVVLNVLHIEVKHYNALNGGIGISSKYMKIQEKIAYLEENHFSEWLKTRREMGDVVSNMCPMFCVCGRLCTGFHESSCRKFQNKVTSETVKKLNHLLDLKN